MCRLATGFAGDGLELDEAARAAPQINNDTASIADADANRLMNPASLKTRGLKLTRRATLGQCRACARPADRICTGSNCCADCLFHDLNRQVTAPA
jgi:hypothetical protein